MHVYHNVNFTEILNRQKSINNETEFIMQAYYGGLIAQYGTLTIYGTGAERGTFNQFANVCINGVTTTLAKEALTHFTSLYSMALRNHGKTNRKKTFYLSQLQEIKPLMKAFGMGRLFENIWEEVRYFDTANYLPQEYAKFGKIKDWEDRTLKVEIPLISLETVIMDNIIANSRFQLESDDIPAFAFIEGFQGLTLMEEDIAQLMQGKSILSRYEECDIAA